MRDRSPYSACHQSPDSPGPTGHLTRGRARLALATAVAAHVADARARGLSDADRDAMAAKEGLDAAEVMALPGRVIAWGLRDQWRRLLSAEPACRRRAPSSRAAPAIYATRLSHGPCPPKARRFWRTISARRSPYRGVRPAMCGVITTFGRAHNGESGGNGSRSVTSRPAPRRAPSARRMASAPSSITEPRATFTTHPSPRASRTSPDTM